MVDSEIIVAIIGGSFAVLAAGVGIIANKLNITPADPPENYHGDDYCQIQETPILRFAGYPLFKKTHCNEHLSKCQHCEKNFCPYHNQPIDNKKLWCRFSCHICDKLEPPIPEP